MNKFSHWLQGPLIFSYDIAAKNTQCFTAAEAFKCCNERKTDTMASSFSSSEFSSPMHVIPLFRSLAAGIPSPQFSESVSELYILFYCTNKIKSVK